MYKGMAFLALLLCSVNVCAGAVLEGHIKGLMLDKNHGDKLFIKLEGHHSGRLACHENGTWQFVMPLTQEIDNSIYTSLLLSAHASGKKVRVDGNGLCDVFGSIETLRRVEMLE